MWNLFSTVQPKVIKPAKSLKQQLLLQQSKSLYEIQQQAKNIINSINSLLKSNPSQNNSNNHNNNNSQSSTNNQTSLFNPINDSQTLINQLKQQIHSLHKKLSNENIKFQNYIIERDQQKINQQQFFKSTMKSYQSKKSQLNSHILHLQNKVQTLQIKGFKTYQLNPLPNNVLNGINPNFINKYLSRIQQFHKLQQTITSFLHKNHQKQIKQKCSSTSNNFHTHKQTHKQNLSLLPKSKLNTITDLQKQLQTILMKETMIEEMLDSKINKYKQNFKKYLNQQKIFKQALKKSLILNQQKRRSSAKLSQNKLSLNKISSTKSSSQNKLITLKQTSKGLTKQNEKSIFSIKNDMNEDKEQNKQNGLNGINQQKKIKMNPSIENNKMQGSECNQKSEFNQVLNEEKQDDKQEERQQERQQEQVDQQQFIQACELLITDRFVQSDEQMLQIEQEEQLNEQQI